MDLTKKFDLIKELGLENAPQEKQMEIVANYTDALQTRIFARLLDELTTEEQKEFDQLLQTNDEEKIGKYLTEKIPNMDFIATDEFNHMKREIIELNDRARQTLDAEMERMKAAQQPPRTPQQ